MRRRAAAVVGHGARRRFRAAGAVAPPAAVASVDVSPSAPSVAVGATVQLSFTPRDSDGNALTGRTATWVSSDATVATVDASGLVTGKGVGSATITATCDGVPGTAALTVTAATDLVTFSDPNVGFLLGPMTTLLPADTTTVSTKQPVPPHDFAYLNGAEQLKTLYLFGASTARPLTGTVSWDPADPTHITGTGTAFLSEVTKGDQIWVWRPNVGYADVVLAGTVVSDTEINVFGTMPWGQAHINGAEAYAATLVGAWDRANIYDPAWCLYKLYYRTGDPQWLDFARQVADNVWASSTCVYGRNRKSGQMTDGPTMITLGLIMRAIDGRPEMWDWILAFCDDEWNVRYWSTSDLSADYMQSPRYQAFAAMPNLYAALLLPDTYDDYLGQPQDGAAKRAALLARVSDPAVWQKILQCQDVTGGYFNTNTVIDVATTQPFIIGVWHTMMVLYHRMMETYGWGTQADRDAVLTALEKSAEYEYRVGFNPEVPYNSSDGVTKMNAGWYYTGSLASSSTHALPGTVDLTPGQTEIVGSGLPMTRFQGVQNMSIGFMSALTGTASWTSGSHTVTGDGTLFLSECFVGQQIATKGASGSFRVYFITSITSDEEMAISSISGAGAFGTGSGTIWDVDNYIPLTGTLSTSGRQITGSADAKFLSELYPGARVILQDGTSDGRKWTTTTYILIESVEDDTHATSRISVGTHTSVAANRACYAIASITDDDHFTLLTPYAGAATTGASVRLYCADGDTISSSNGGIPGARQRNPTMLQVYGYLWSATKDAKWKTFGDAIYGASFGDEGQLGGDGQRCLGGNNSHGDSGQVKEWCEAFRDTQQYLAWRLEV